MSMSDHIYAPQTHHFFSMVNNYTTLKQLKFLHFLFNSMLSQIQILID